MQCPICGQECGQDSLPIAEFLLRPDIRFVDVWYCSHPGLSYEEIEDGRKDPYEEPENVHDFMWEKFTCERSVCQMVS